MGVVPAVRNDGIARHVRRDTADEAGRRRNVEPCVGVVVRRRRTGALDRDVPERRCDGRRRPVLRGRDAADIAEESLSGRGGCDLQAGDREIAAVVVAAELLIGSADRRPAAAQRDIGRLHEIDARIGLARIDRRRQRFDIRSLPDRDRALLAFATETAERGIPSLDIADLAVAEREQGIDLHRSHPFQFVLPVGNLLHVVHGRKVGADLHLHVVQDHALAAADRCVFERRIAVVTEQRGHAREFDPVAFSLFLLVDRQFRLHGRIVDIDHRQLRLTALGRFVLGHGEHHGAVALDVGRRRSLGDPTLAARHDGQFGAPVHVGDDLHRIGLGARPRQRHAADRLHDDRRLRAHLLDRHRAGKRPGIALRSAGHGDRGRTPARRILLREREDDVAVTLAAGRRDRQPVGLFVGLGRCPRHVVRRHHGDRIVLRGVIVLDDGLLGQRERRDEGVVAGIVVRAAPRERCRTDEQYG